MKITEKIIIPIVAVFIHILPIIMYKLNLKDPFQISCLFLGIVWFIAILGLIIGILTGEIKFEFKIPLPFQKKFEESKRKKSHNQMIDTKILELKADSVCYIENEKRLLKNLEAIEELEKLKL